MKYCSSSKLVRTLIILYNSTHAAALVCSSIRWTCMVAGMERGVTSLSMSNVELERPLVTLKLAVDRQGAVDDIATKPQRFTCDESLDAVHRLRRASGAILVGIGTIVRDNPSLTVRRVPLFEGQEQPLRVVLDRSLRIPDSNSIQVLSDGNPTVIMFVNDPLSFSKARAAELMISCLGMPVGVFDIPTDAPEDGCPLDRVLSAVKRKGIDHLMVEGGPTIAKQFLAQKLVDRAIIIQAPVTFENPLLGGIDDRVLQSAGLQQIDSTFWGVDSVRFWLREGLEWPNGSTDRWP